ncbi:MAG: DUF169 domain-containing protein [Clostridiales bacterium]|nr:DUF169 domain-containing protein [Clostridiales bacterium]
MDNSKAAAELQRMLRLRYEPIAIKMIENESEIPSDAIYPPRDMGKRLAACQAYALARRDRKTIYMDRNSEWCWCPQITLGFSECEVGSDAFNLVCEHLGFMDIDTAKEFFAKFPRFPYGKYIGIVSAPLCDCTFEPDVVLIYCNNAQLRSMLWAIKNTTGKVVETPLDAIDSCVYSVVVPQLENEYRVTLPDIGEYERAGADEDEIILSIPRGKLGELVEGVAEFYKFGMGYLQLQKAMEFDFPRPPFYNTLFEMWGLEQGEEWNH